MDFDFGGSKKSQAKSGRRAKGTSQKGNEKQEEMNSLPQPSDVGQESPPRPARRMAGWGESGAGRRERDMKGVEDSRLLVNDDSPRTRINSDDEDGEIQAIPDLDDFHEDDLAQQVAAPPSISMNQVATYRELEGDLQRHSTFTLLDNEIDLKLLARHMGSESEIREEDETWEWDRLFTQVSSNLKSVVKSKSETQNKVT